MTIYTSLLCWTKKKKYAIFSKSYVSFPIVLATKDNIGFIPGMSTLKNKKIAVGKDYSIDELFGENYPEIHIVRTKNTDEALKLLDKGKVFAVADILPVIAYKIDKYHFPNIKISGRTNWNFNVSIMARKDYTKLISAVNKAIDSITKTEKMKIDRKWTAVRYNSGYSIKYILSIIAVSTIIILIILGWIIYLKREISKRKKLEKELEKLATTDRLTSIYNRYKMDVSLQKQIEISKRYKRPLSFIYFDIDHFKKINDRYGHKVGDLVLIELSDLIKKSIRKSDIFGRWGGEEFLIILPETKKEEAIELSEKLRRTVQKYKFKNIQYLTCSFGVANNRKSDDAEEVILRIDKRLYVAKKRGRNRVESI
ncbi:MAG: diguanylate cyclase [Sulfurospirillum sp.]